MDDPTNKRPYTVRNIPLPLQPFFLVYGYGFAAAMVLVWAVMKASTTVRHLNPPEGEKHGHYIYCCWHRDLPSYFAAFFPYRKPYVWLNHPLWYMKPVHLFLRWMGVGELVLGSSGNAGRKALAGVIEGLRKGRSTFLNPDGPAGPPFEMKRGVVDMSLQSGLPVIPLRFELSRFATLPGWDSKRLPLPFSTVTVHYGTPVTAKPESESQVMDAIKEQL